MKDIAIVCCVFIFTTLVHAVIHRVLRKMRMITLASMSVYILGCFVLVLLVGSSLPLSAIIFYILLTAMIFPFYLGVILGGETPASILMHAFQEKPRRSEKELFHLFTEYGILGKRIDDLKQTGMITQRGDHFTITKRGEYIVFWFTLYQRIFRQR